MRSERSRERVFSPFLFFFVFDWLQTEALVRWVYSVSFIIYCSLSFAFSFLSFCLLSPSLLRQSVPSSLISAQFGGALLESCNIYSVMRLSTSCELVIHRVRALCENITLLQFKYIFFQRIFVLSFDLVYKIWSLSLLCTSPLLVSV